MANFEEILKNSKPAPKGSSRKGGKNILSFGIINNENGKRISLSSGLYKSIGEPEYVQITINKGILCIGSELGVDDTEEFKVSSYKGRGIIYDTGLVEGLTEHFNLSFEEKTSMTVNKVKVEEINGVPVAFVKMKAKQEKDE